MLLLVMFYRALLMFMVIALLGFVGVHDCCSFGLLVFVVFVFLGFVGIHVHAFLDSWCSCLCFLGSIGVLGHCFHGFYWC